MLVKENQVHPKRKREKTVDVSIPKVNMKTFFTFLSSTSNLQDTEPPLLPITLDTVDPLEAYVESGFQNINESASEDLLLGPSQITPSDAPEISTCSASVQVPLRKCKGCSILTQDGIFSNFPFQLLAELDFVFERDVFHHISCAENLYMCSDHERDVNLDCENLRYSTILEGLVKRLNDKELHNSHVNNKYLTFGQLDKRVGHFRNIRDNLTLKDLNNVRKINNLGRTLKLHEHFMYLIKENKINNLHELVNVALRNKRSISYIIEKMTFAIRGLYNPRYRTDDKELAFLILHYGGPGLLEIVHKAIQLPSVSTAYRLLSNSKPMKSSIDITTTDVVSNIQFDERLRYSRMFKVDET